ncbi:MAG TPA: N-acetyltransferase [Methanoregulaceae archaeon]|nr:N-acetyltransferase [Methanoregulaceae archaeon]HPD75259.1 N-acetyltransferase [Methanoregulaceae archaeon]HRY74816.1 N-acetyltransferase [Methanoregulaceae archaeon]
MIALRPLTPSDIPCIRAWPPYPAEFRELEYAIRDGGWLDEYRTKSGTDIFIADDEGEILGFSLISRGPGGVAEFRIALHPRRLGQGIGKTVARLTLGHAFSDPGIRAVRLIVRKTNPRAQRLYEALQFKKTGECTEDIQGKPVEFFAMEIDREKFGWGKQ